LAQQPQPVQPAFSFLKDRAIVVTPKNAGTKQGDPVTAATSRVIAGARLQKTYVQALIDGKELPKMDVAKQTAGTWFYRAADGTYETRLRYGQAAIPLDGGKTGVRIGELKDLLPFYDAVIAAIEKRELDAVITEMQKAKSAALTHAA
jgi:hypothetical protein